MGVVVDVFGACEMYVRCCFDVLGVGSGGVCVVVASMWVAVVLVLLVVMVLMPLVVVVARAAWLLSRLFRRIRTSALSPMAQQKWKRAKQHLDPVPAFAVLTSALAEKLS